MLRPEPHSPRLTARPSAPSRPKSGWADDVERLFREGAPFVGALPASGVAERRVMREEREPVSDLMGRAEAQNAAIIASIRDDAHAAELHAGAVADAALGRLSTTR